MGRWGGESCRWGHRARCRLELGGLLRWALTCTAWPAFCPPQILSAFGDIALAIGDRFEVGGVAVVPLGLLVLLQHCKHAALHCCLPDSSMQSNPYVLPPTSPERRSTCSTWSACCRARCS